MAKRQTARIASAALLDGDSPYLVRARKALPYLVRQAKAGEPIFYSSLAQELHMPNPRNLNYVLGAIGNALIGLNKLARLQDKIPPIQALVINKRDLLPGEGIGTFLGATYFGELTKTQKKKVLAAHLAAIFTYPHWDWVLEQFALEPLRVDVQRLMAQARQYGEGGESEKHLHLKRYVAANPAVLGLRPGLGPGAMEVPLVSGDRLDVQFIHQGLRIGVEVKSSISNTKDLLRGLFQCVKYRHLIEAEQVVANQEPNSRVVLVLQGGLPAELLPVKHMLGIEVIENITPLPS
jgi:hypothetical protein